MKTKVCKCCEKRKKVESFYYSSTYPGNRDLYCIVCKKEKSKQYRLNNPEKYQIREKEYRIEAADRIFEYQKEYYARPDIKKKVAKYQKEYKKKNAKKLKKYLDDYAAANRERLKKQGLEYYYNNRAEILEKRRIQRINKQKKK